MTFVEVGDRAAAALARAPHELLFEFSRGEVWRCGGEIVWIDSDPEAFSPCGATMRLRRHPERSEGPVCHMPGDSSVFATYDDSIAAFLRTRNAQILLGLGPGLTPAGDDFLGGWFLVRHRLGYRESIDMSATHEISRARLSMHLGGEGTRAEVRFVDALLTGGDAEAAARILRNHGHTSGEDFMRGARAALS